MERNSPITRYITHVVNLPFVYEKRAQLAAFFFGKNEKLIVTDVVEGMLDRAVKRQNDRDRVIVIVS